MEFFFRIQDNGSSCGFSLPERLKQPTVARIRSSFRTLKLSKLSRRNQKYATASCQTKAFHGDDLGPAGQNELLTGDVYTTAVGVVVFFRAF
jgi:hypothetical protein